jgi:hypothetical protein
MPKTSGGCITGLTVLNSDPTNTGWRNSQFDAATAKLMVHTARNRPRTRRAGSPTTRAAAVPTAVATRAASSQGSSHCR